MAKAFIDGVKRWILCKMIEIDVYSWETLSWSSWSLGSNWEAILIKEQIVKWQDDDYLRKNYLFGGMSNKYYDQYYIKYTFAKDICDTL